MKGVVQLGPNPFHQIKRLRLLQLLYENCTDSFTCEANTPNFGQNGNQLVEYKQLTIPTVYRIVQLGLNPVHDTSKPNLHLNCIELGLVRAKVCTVSTHQHNELD